MADEMAVVGSANARLQLAEHAKAQIVIIRHQVEKRRWLLTARQVRRGIDVGEVVPTARAGEQQITLARCKWYRCKTVKGY